jgi:hypothetical protein
MKHITIVLISSINHKLCEFSIENTLKNTPYVEEVLIYSNKKILSYPYFYIDSKFNISDYNVLLNKTIFEYVKTDFVLVIQPDGMASNLCMWNDKFLDYDYIGAPFENLSVGNGGFSLRSKKLLEALISDEYTFNNKNEDELICKDYKHTLEKDYKINFAPLDLAGLFSREWVLCKNNTFGFHGFWNFPLCFNFETVKEFILNNKELHKDFNFNALEKHLIRSYNIGFENSFKLFYNEILNKNFYKV